MNINDGVVRSKSMFCAIAEVSFTAGSNSHAAGSTSTVNLASVINLATGVRESRTITVTVGASAVNAQTLADMWVTALSAVLPAYGGFVARAAASYGNFIFGVPYTDEAPYPSWALQHSGHFAGLTNVAVNNPVMIADLEAAQRRYAVLQSAKEEADHQVDVLELQLASTGSGSSTAPGSTSVTVNNPATNTAQTVMAAIAGFGVGFMVRGARQEE